jgi:hypothetical protein
MVINFQVKRPFIVLGVSLALLLPLFLWLVNFLVQEFIVMFPMLANKALLALLALIIFGFGLCTCLGFGFASCLLLWPIGNSISLIGLLVIANLMLLLTVAVICFILRSARTGFMSIGLFVFLFFSPPLYRKMAEESEVISAFAYWFGGSVIAVFLVIFLICLLSTFLIVTVGQQLTRAKQQKIPPSL